MGLPPRAARQAAFGAHLLLVLEALGVLLGAPHSREGALHSTRWGGTEGTKPGGVTRAGQVKWAGWVGQGGMGTDTQGGAVQCPPFTSGFFHGLHHS